MKFNICYMGPEWLYHLRRDFILSLKYGLEDLGHTVNITGKRLESDRFNLVIGAYFLNPEKCRGLIESGVQIAHINTEIIANDMLNHNPDKVDFLGSYLPAMQAGQFIWDVVIDNLSEHSRYKNNAHFIKWGWHPKMEDIIHVEDKDLDFYFFGMLSPRRKEIITTLINEYGLRGVADHSCPYFQRNDYISRAKIQLNIVQDDRYTHVNSFRICYLANNRCAIVSERENDPAGYLSAVKVSDDIEEFMGTTYHLAKTNEWKILSESIYEDFHQKHSMTTILEELLEQSFKNSDKK